MIIYGIGVEQRFVREMNEYKQRQIFKVLADDKRVEILRLLVEREWYNNELAKHFQLTTATMSYHISKLAELGLISFNSGEQNRIYYRIEKEKIRELVLSAVKNIIGE